MIKLKIGTKEKGLNYPDLRVGRWGGDENIN